MNDEMDSLNLDNLEELRRTAISAHNGLGDAALYSTLVEHHLPLLMAELRAYRDGGVTEEILRRNDGYIKVGRGCVIALAPEAQEKIDSKEPGFPGQGSLVHGSLPVTAAFTTESFMPLRWRRRLLQNKEGSAHASGAPLLEYWDGKTWTAVPEEN